MLVARRKQKKDGVIATCDSFLRADPAYKNSKLASFPGRSRSQTGPDPRYILQTNWKAWERG